MYDVVEQAGRFNGPKARFLTKDVQRYKRVTGVPQ